MDMKNGVGTVNNRTNSNNSGVNDGNSTSGNGVGTVNNRANSNNSGVNDGNSTSGNGVSVANNCTNSNNSGVNDENSANGNGENGLLSVSNLKNGYVSAGNSENGVVENSLASANINSENATTSANNSENRSVSCSDSENAENIGGARLAEGSANHKQKTRKPKVLISDDGSNQVTELALILKKHGFLTRFCQNEGRALIKALEAFAADFIVCDTLMSFFGATDVAKRVNIYPLRIRPKVIAYTKYHPASLTWEAQEVGIEKVFDKPINPYEISEFILARLPENTVATPLSAFEKTQTSSRLEANITDYLLKMGFMMRFSGFELLKKALFSAVENKTDKISVTKEVYPSLAKKFDSNPGTVERAMRYSISKAFENSPESFAARFGKCKKAPTNAEFICRSAHFLNNTKCAPPDLLPKETK